MRLLRSNRIRIWRISTYARVFLEPKLPFILWQSHLAQLGVMSRKEDDRDCQSGKQGVWAWIKIRFRKQKGGGLNSSFVHENQLLAFGAVNAVVAVFLEINVYYLPWQKSWKVVAFSLCFLLGCWVGAYTRRLIKELRRGGTIETDYHKAWQRVSEANRDQPPPPG